MVIPVVISALQLSDIPKTITKVPTALSELNGGAKLLAHELFTNDVLYAEAALDMSGLQASLLPLVPLFCRSLTQVGIQQSRSAASALQLLAWMSCMGYLTQPEKLCQLDNEQSFPWHQHASAVVIRLRTRSSSSRSSWSPPACYLVQAWLLGSMLLCW